MEELSDKSAISGQRLQTAEAGDEVRALRRLLSRLPNYLENGWNDLGDGRAFFGDGSSGENGIRTNANIVFAAAVLLKHADACGLSQETSDHLRMRLSSLVRYLVTSYVGGENKCAQGGHWGLNWQSSWWATKLALGVDVAGERLDAAEHEAVHRMIVREADRHLDRLIPTGLAQDTKAEETAWDAEALAVALSLAPSDDHTARWRRRLVEFCVNTFSRPSDRDSQREVDGMVVGDVLRSCNIHEDGTLENHGAAHFCYVASPLISKAWCDYALRRKGEPVPEALAFNVAPVWEFAEPTFLENRFAYIGGQDWARYTYGEYFILPALVYLASIGCGERGGEIFRRRLRLLEFEAAASDDGSFYGARFTKGRYVGQFAKYETDCFACVALALEQLGECGLGNGMVHKPAPRVARISHESLTCYARTENCFLSFAWQTLDASLPNVSFVPLADDSLAEWHGGNLIGSLQFLETVRWVGVKAMERTERGLRVEGQHSLRTSRRGVVAEHLLSLELIDDTLHVSSRYWTTRLLRAVRVTGLDWCVPNDVFNGHQRRYFHEASDGSVGCVTSTALDVPPAPADRGVAARLRRKLKLDGEVLPFGASRWLNIDDRIGVVQRRGESFALRRFRHKAAPWNSLTLEKIEAPVSRWRFNVPAGTVLLDAEFLFHVGTRQDTHVLAQSLRTTESHDGE